MKLELCECRSIKPASIRQVHWRCAQKEHACQVGTRCRRREISYSGRFLRVDGVLFFAAGTATSRERTATANLILITRQPRRSPIAAGGIGVTLLPLECRSGSLRADSYLCATLGARDGRRSERAEKTEEGGCSTRDAHPLTVKPRPHSRDSSKSKYSRARAHASALCSSPPADSSSLPSSSSRYISLYLVSCFLPALSLFSSEFAVLRVSFPLRRPTPRLHAKANTTLIYLPVSAGTRA